jgi:hypothetical protein
LVSYQGTTKEAAEKLDRKGTGSAVPKNSCARDGFIRWGTVLSGFGFVSGHDFSRATKGRKGLGFSPCGSAESAIAGN